MSDRWMLRGTQFANCNCDWGCPCQFNSPTTHGQALDVISNMRFNAEGKITAMRAWWRIEDIRPATQDDKVAG